VEVRRASDADAAGIAAVHVATWRAAYAHVFDEAWLAQLDVDEREQRWRTELERGEDVFVALEGDGIVAFVSVGPSPEHAPDGELYAIYALPEAWGTGAGPALMRAALDALRARGFHAAVLTVLDDNPRARRFYEREGWALEEGSFDERRHLGVPTVRYRIAL
jgi:ribosomal protein S18 acetylase RimI-like enzyme